MCELAVSTVRISEVEHGSLGAIGGCRGIGLSRARASKHMHGRYKRAAQAVGRPLEANRPNLEGRRLNTHLTSIVSTSFNMPTEVLAGGLS